MIARRIEANLTYSIYRWLTTVQYQATELGSPATLVSHFALSGQPPLSILPAYPDDLVMIQGPTLSVTGPMVSGPGTRFMGESVNEKLYTVSVYGFVAGYNNDGFSRMIRDRLLSDLTQLFEEVAAVEGVTLYAVETDTVVGRFDVSAVRHRVLPVNAPAIEAERYKFLVEADIQFA